MQDLVAEYQQYQDATYVFSTNPFVLTNLILPSVEEEVEYEEEVAEEEH